MCTLLLGTQVCLAPCTSRSECRAGYQCWMGGCRPDCIADPASCGSLGTCGADGQCTGPECTLDSECGAMRRCMDGMCIDVPPPMDAGPMLLGTGEPCTDDAQCATDVCLPADRGGVCSGACIDSIDCISVVDFDASCGPVERDGDIVALCVPRVDGGAAIGQVCTGDDDCVTRTCEGGRCTAVCSMPSDCLRGQICDAITRAPGSYQGCTYAPQAPGTVTFEEIDLGDINITAGFGTSDIRFGTPPGSVSVMLQAEMTGGDRLPLGFFEVHDPRDRLIFDLETIAMLGDPPIRWIPSDTEEAISMLVPNCTRDRVTYTHGRHEVSILAFPRMDGDTGRVSVHLSALVKRVRGTLSTGTVDLDVYLVGLSGGVTAANASTNAKITQMLSRYGTILGAAGIDVGDVAFHDVTGADATRYQVINSTDGPDSELAGLFRLSAASGSGRRLAVFLVRGIDGSRPGFSTLGIAGGIPGAAGIFGTQHSGVVLAFESISTGNAAGHVLAHESGHFLGLYHVTESDRPCGAGETPPGCAPWGGTDVIDDTSRGDTTNLMHWSIVGSGTNTRITAGQGFVLLRSPIVR